MKTTHPWALGVAIALPLAFLLVSIFQVDVRLVVLYGAGLCLLLMWIFDYRSDFGGKSGT